jgi:TRAP-type C4-dicarboxylate transport system substrate-binding protein
MTNRSPIVLLALAVAALSAAGCGGSGSPDKAGGEATPITLRLATPDRAGFPGANLIAYFADDVRRRSHGSIRIIVTYNAAGDGPQWDQRVAGLIRIGKFDLGQVPSRAWDVLGVRSMQALQAPFLLQTPMQVQRVAEDAQLQSTMLAGLRPLGITGLALVPESLRHPFAFRGMLRSLHDFSGASIRAPRSDATWAILRALGARPLDLEGAAFRRGAADGTVTAAESDLAQAAATLPAPATATSNVTFFPRVDTLVVNTRVFAGLSTADRATLKQAAADAVAWAPHSNPSESAAAQTFCRDGGRVVLASPHDVATLVSATQSVTVALERDPPTRALITRIREVAGAPSTARAPICQPVQRTAPPIASTSGQPTSIDGIYRNTITMRDLVASGVDRATAIENAVDVHTIVLRRGRLHDTARGGVPGPPCDGSYTVRGHTYTFAWDKTTPCSGDFTARWSLRGGELRLTSISAPDAVDQTIWGLKPFRKIG